MKKMMLAVLLLSSVNAFAEKNHVYCLDKSKQQILFNYIGQGMNGGGEIRVELVARLNSEKTVVVMCSNRPGILLPTYMDDTVQMSAVWTKNLFVPAAAKSKDKYGNEIIGSNKEYAIDLKIKRTTWEKRYFVETNSVLENENQLAVKRRTDNR